MGAFDDEGFLTLKDRSKDLIISGGSNIYPREVEEVLLRHPGVFEVSVIGRPHADWGEEVVACIVPGPAQKVAGRRIGCALPFGDRALQAAARLCLSRDAAEEQLRQGTQDRTAQATRSDQTTKSETRTKESRKMTRRSRRMFGTATLGLLAALSSAAFNSPAARRRAVEDRLQHGPNRPACRHRKIGASRDDDVGRGHQRQGRPAGPASQARPLRRSKQSRRMCRRSTPSLSISTRSISSTAATPRRSSPRQYRSPCSTTWC